VWYHAIETGVKLDCAMDIVDIAVLCENQKPIFARPSQYEQVADMARASFASDSSDHLALANAFNQYMLAREKVEEDQISQRDLEVFCKMYFLDIHALEEARKSREKLGHFLKRGAKLLPTRASTANTENVRQALAIAFSHKTAILHSGDEYRTVHENVAARLEPLSSVIDSNSEWIVYDRLNKIGGKFYLETATTIKAEWLVVSWNTQK
jgi:HrpA-like RNA helicase